METAVFALSLADAYAKGIADPVPTSNTGFANRSRCNVTGRDRLNRMVIVSQCGQTASAVLCILEIHPNPKHQINSRLLQILPQC